MSTENEKVLAQCEKCDKAARGDRQVAAPVRRGLCDACFTSEMTGTEEKPGPTGFVRTVEEWAKGKGMLEQLAPGVDRKVTNPKGQRVVAVSLKASGVTARAANPRHAYFMGAKLANQWPTGHECTEAEFDHATTTAETGVICR